MSDSIKIIPPPHEQHRDTYIEMLAAYIPRDRIEALAEVLGLDLFFIFNELQGQHVRFPKLKTLGELDEQAEVYDLVTAKLKDGFCDQDAFDEVGYDIGKKAATIRRLYGQAIKQLERADNS